MRTKSGIYRGYRITKYMKNHNGQPDYVASAYPAETGGCDVTFCRTMQQAKEIIDEQIKLIQKELHND